MMFWLLVPITIALLAHPGSSQTSSPASTFKSTDGKYTASWSIIDDDTIEFMISATTTGWIAIGWSPNPRGHLNTAAVVAWVIGNETTILDTLSNSRSTPTPAQFLQSAPLSGFETNGQTTVRFRRPIQSTDADHLTIPNAPIFMIYAYGATDGDSATSYPIHSVSARGVAQVNFLQSGLNVVGNTNVTATYLFGLIREPGAAMTVIVAFILAILALVQDSHRLVKRCRECRRRRAFRGFAGADGFAPALERAPIVAPPVTSAVLRPAIAATFDSDAFRLQTDTMGSVQIGAGAPGESIVSDDEDISSDSESLELNVIPSGGFFRGSQPVPYRPMPGNTVSTSLAGSVPAQPLQVFIHQQKSISSPGKNALLRLWRQRLFGTDIVVSELVVFTAYLILQGVLVLAWPRRSLDPVTSLGYLASANAFWTAVPGTRNSAISLILWAPVDKTIRYHRWIARVMIGLALAHGIWELIIQTPNIGQILNVLMGDSKNATGGIAMASALIILLSSLQSVRRHLFQLFYYTHFIFILFYVYLWMHSPASRPYIIAAITVYALDRALRLLRGNLVPFRATEVQTLPGNVVRIRFPKRAWARYTAGQYVFVNFPTIAPLEWHPFSLSSGPKDDHCEIHVKALGNTTRALFKSIQGSLSIIAPLMRVEGPYGHLSSRYQRYSHVVLLGGGVGVTPLISIIKDIYQLDMSQAAKARHPKSALIKHVYLVWSVPTEFEWAWFAETLVKARVLAALSHYPRLTLAGHITQQKSTADPSLIVGRPDLETVFRYVESSMIGNPFQYQQLAQTKFADSMAINTDQPGAKGRAAVYVCGPRHMVTEASDIARRRTRANVRFDFHHEIFEF